jgi:hypothetical protein
MLGEIEFAHLTTSMVKYDYAPQSQQLSTEFLGQRSNERSILFITDLYSSSNIVFDHSYVFHHIMKTPSSQS